MSDIIKLVGISLGVIALVAVVTIAPQILYTIDSANSGLSDIDTISVFILEEGTTATHVTCAIYNANTNRLMGITEEQLITTDAWNVCDFENNVNVNPGDEYILVAFADGDLAIPSDGTNYVTDPGNTYDAFPSTIDYAGTETSEMSIYAIYA